jgi:hypothetical protein
MVISIEVMKAVGGVVRMAVSDLHEVIIPTEFLVGLVSGQEVGLRYIKDR